MTPPSRRGPLLSPRTRSDFVWDVLILQVKLIIGGVLSFLLGPATLIAAFLDLIFKSGPHGRRFYRVLDWGRQFDETLGLYAALHGRDDGEDVPSELNCAKDIPEAASEPPSRLKPREMPEFSGDRGRANRG